MFVQPGDPEASHCAAHLPQNVASFPSNNTNTNTNTDNNNNGGGGGGGSGGTNKRRRVSQGRKPAAAAAAPTPAAPRAGRSSACQIEGCGKTATHGDQRKATHCAAHKEKGMTDHKHRPCENVVPKACLKQPSFGWPGEGRKRFCGAHREAGMVDIRTCEREGCGARASHGFQKRRARFCATHCQPGMMVVANKVGRRVLRTLRGVGGVGGERWESSAVCRHVDERCLEPAICLFVDVLKYGEGRRRLQHVQISRRALCCTIAWYSLVRSRAPGTLPSQVDLAALRHYCAMPRER